MKVITNIRIAALFLFFIPFSALILIVFLSNHLISYSTQEFPNGVVNDYVFQCNSSNNYCVAEGQSFYLGEDIELKKLKMLDCEKYIYSNEIYFEDELIYKHLYGKESVGNDARKKLIYSKKEYLLKIRKTEQENEKCIKNSNIYFIYKIFPQLGSSYEYWKNNASFASIEQINPFFDGKSSISNIAKRKPFTNIFNPLMYVSSFLMLFFWTNYYLFFKNISLIKNNKFLYFGILSSVFLFLHILFLNGSIELENSKLVRKIIIFLFLLFELLAEFFLAKKIYDNKINLFKYMKISIINLKLYFVYLIVLVTFISLSYMSIVDQSDEFNNILEWNYFVLLMIFYLFSNFIWKKTIF